MVGRIHGYISALGAACTLTILAGVIAGSSASAQEIPLSPDRRARIIAAYGDALSNRSSTVGRESTLPFSKNDIRKALLSELQGSTPKNRDALEIGYVELESFVSDADYKAVLAFEKATVQAEALMSSETAEDTRHAAQLIAATSGRVREIQAEIIARQEKRLRELRVHR